MYTATTNSENGGRYGGQLIPTSLAALNKALIYAVNKYADVDKSQHAL